MGAGVRYVPVLWAGAQASFERLRLPDRLDFDLYDESVTTSANVPADRWRYDGRVSPVPALIIEASSSRTALAWQLTPGTRVMGRWTRAISDLRGDVRWWGVRFARANYVQGDLSAGLGALEWRGRGGRRFLLDAERARGSARGRG